jgi:hypothetical protein
MARRPLLTDEERQLLFGVPGDPDALARHYIFTRSDQDLVVGRRGAANRLGFAVQLALLRHPGIGLAQMEEPIDALVEWLAAQLDIPAAAFADYADRPQTMRNLADLGLDRTLLLRGTQWWIEFPGSGTRRKSRSSCPGPNCSWHLSRSISLGIAACSRSCAGDRCLRSAAHFGYQDTAYR